MTSRIKQHYNAILTMDPKKQKAMVVLMIIVGLVAVPAVGIAGGASGGHEDDFSEIWDVLVDWTQGVLGRIVALTMILVGIVMGVARQSIMAFVMGPAAGMGLFYASDIINAIMTASMVS